MRWLCCLFVSAAAAQGGGAPAKTLRFDLGLLPDTRDSFVFFLDHQPRGFAVWQYEARTRDSRQVIVHSAYSEFEPVEEERLRVVLDRRTGAPLESSQHYDFFAPKSDTIMEEHELTVRGGRITGRRSVGTADGKVQTVAVDTILPAGAVWFNYELYAAAVTNALPGDSLAVPAYVEFEGSVTSLSFVADQPTAVRVPAGTFDALPLRSGNFRLYVTRQAPRRVVKGETLDGRFSFELAHTAPVVPTDP